MQIRTILYQYIKTLIKHVFLLNFTHELLTSFRRSYNATYKSRLYVTQHTSMRNIKPVVFNKKCKQCKQSYLTSLYIYIYRFI